MDENVPVTVENFIGNWNGAVPNYPLTAADLKVPQNVMGAVFEVFARLGIDRDASPREEINDHIIYYWDLVPVINMIRVINHLVSVMPQVEAKISIPHFLQPTSTASQSILLLLFNLMVFNEQKLSDIEPYEKELFSKSDQVKLLDDRKNKLLEMLNEQAEEKGKSAEIMEKLPEQIKIHEEELKQENEAYNAEKPELDEFLKENHQLEHIIDQRKTQLDALNDEIEKRKALVFYDANDIIAQAAKAAQDVQDAEEKLNGLRTKLVQKENSLKNLQSIKPNLDVANNYLDEIEKIVESLKDYENGDLDSDSGEGELNVLNTEISEMESQFTELKSAREVTIKKQLENQTKRQQDKALIESNLHEAEEKDKKCQERTKKAAQRINNIKELTHKYNEEKTNCFEELNTVQQDFQKEIKNMDDSLLKVIVNTEKDIKEKLQNKT